MAAGQKYAELVTQCERLLRAGRVAHVARLLRGISPARVGTAERLPLARAARRSGLFYLGLRLLRGHLREGDRRQRAARTAEYAVLLYHVGYGGEALALLRGIPPDHHPDLLLAQSWCLFERWEFAPTVPLLRAYVARQEDPYLRLAGEVNLGEALLACGDVEESRLLLDAAIRQSEKDGHVRLLANALHLRARANVALGKISDSDRDLERAYALFGGIDASDAILIRRQRAINEALRTRSSAPLRRFRAEALRAGDAESVRETDLAQLSLAPSRALLDRLYYGTPYPRFRRGLRGAPSATFTWGSRSGPVFDLGEKKVRWRDGAVVLTSQYRVLLLTLLGDFYRSPSVGGLFAGLFPGAYFDPATSPARVHQALKRLRRWFRENRIPLDVVCARRRYSLVPRGPVAVRIPLALRKSESLDPLSRLEEGLAAEFTAKQARELLGLSKATVTRLLASAVDSGKLARRGRGKLVRYEF